MALIFDGWSQASQRRYVRKKDQHGREWGVNIEVKTGDPTGNWTAPASPLPAPPEYLTRDPEDPENIHKVRIDYARWKADQRAALEEWDAQAAKLMRARYNATYRPDMKLDPDLVDVIGPRPDPVEPIIAAEQGEPWVLGFAAEPGPKLRPFVAHLMPKAAAGEEIDFTEPDFTEPDFSGREDEPTPPAPGTAKARRRAQPAAEAA